MVSLRIVPPVITVNAFLPLTIKWFFTRFGHEDSVTAIDSLSRDRAVTAGGRDRTLRVWKVVEESQLVFNGQGNM